MTTIHLSGSTYTVEKDSNLWKVAKTICNQSGKTTNADIVNEMNRLAKLNGYNNFEELGQKFGKIGNTIKVSEEVAGKANQPNSQTKVKTPNKTEQKSVVTNPVKTNTVNEDKNKTKQSAINNSIQTSTKLTKTVAQNDTFPIIKTFLKPLDGKIKIDEAAAKQAEIKRINSLADNKTKVIEWNKQNKPTKNYILVDKKTCTATVYSPDGKALKSFEVGVGKEIGDGLNDGFGYSGKVHKRTTPGEYTIDIDHSEAEDYGKVSFSLGTKGNMFKKDPGFLALHKIPNSLVKERKHLFKDGNTSNNRMSYGCVNFLEEDFQELQKYVGKGSKVYILPEEKDNSLQLIAQNNNIEFVQTKYKQQG